MRRVTQALLTASAMVGLTLVVVVPARADGWGNVECGQGGNPSCDLGAGTDGTHRPDAPPPPSAPGPAQPRGEEPQESGTPGEQANCTYVRSDYQPPAGGTRTIAAPGTVAPHGEFRTIAFPSGGAAQPGGADGAWYVYRCAGPDFRDALYRAPVFIPDAEAPDTGPAPLPSPEELARRARSQLRLPKPEISSNPAGTQLVRVPTWLWLDRAIWRPRSATASVPGVSVTATAAPRSVSWSMGDGTTVTCTGPGTPFRTGGDPRAASPDCGHTYQRSSATAPGERFPVTATVSWRVTWSGAGASGTFPDLTTSASTSFRVAEAHALGTG